MSEDLTCRRCANPFKRPRDGSQPVRCYECELTYQRDVGALRAKLAGFQSAKLRSDMDAQTAVRRSELLSHDINTVAAELNAVLLAGAERAPEST